MRKVCNEDLLFCFLFFDKQNLKIYNVLKKVKISGDLAKL